MLVTHFNGRSYNKSCTTNNSIHMLKCELSITLDSFCHKNYARLKTPTTTTGVWNQFEYSYIDLVHSIRILETSDNEFFMVAILHTLFYQRTEPPISEVFP
ncbi:hypothetical protein CEXT_549931 [Caerostris extrusa]|uniref:Uncharacterized protein n=1 Tax=Caerostris extrusa TaxID=172846 RepID=A0AAV4M4N8_CAEEX|nr:hypothetical protein CEXT_549931 [Caerostris extrusa]